MNNTFKRSLAGATIAVVAVLGMAGTAHADTDTVHGVGDLIDISEVLTLDDVLRTVPLLNGESTADSADTTTTSTQSTATGTGTTTTGAAAGLGRVGSLLGLTG
ncbi:hypothetical protein [Streptomyces sp. NPDC053755]|uniref:hypothetical protein n=1 Tax=Streptomyces sp. NPDC053755 TaxID=3155815 RepID=UPI00343F6A8B